MRENPTPGEALLWARLEGCRLRGLEFVQQQIIHKYIVDFYCPAKRVAVEIDGSWHRNGKTAVEDFVRDFVLEELGVSVLRIPAAIVHNKIEIGLEKIAQRCLQKLLKKPRRKLLKSMGFADVGESFPKLQQARVIVTRGVGKPPVEIPEWAIRQREARTALLQGGHE